MIRIVRMHFREDGVDPFLAAFREHMEAIRNVPGCSHLELLRDAHDPLAYTTLSHWKNVESLEEYRKSELFKSVWATVKKGFSRSAEALSLEKFIEV